MGGGGGRERRVCAMAVSTGRTAACSTSGRAFRSGRSHALRVFNKESRIGKQPVVVPKGVEVKFDANGSGTGVAVKGKLGQLTQDFTEHVAFNMDGDSIKVARANDSLLARQQHGLARSLLDNMVTGVSSGFEKKLTMIGVGYKGEVQGKKLILNLGYSHPIEVEIDKSRINLTITGFDKQLLGQFAANVRSKRPPEPYKGKGVQYVGERILRKAGKSGKK